MSELYRHLLIPPDADFVPERRKVALYFNELGTLGALPNDRKFRVITHTGKAKPIARNAKTGEVYYGPELKVGRFTELQPAIDAINGEEAFDLFAEGTGPTAIPPFDLYSANNYEARQPGVPWKQPYSFSVHCQLRQKVTHVHHSAFGCDCELKPDEPGFIKFPWSDVPIQSSGLASARFSIEFAVGDYLMPMITDWIDILDSRLVAAANRVFGVGFTQGCRINDD